jgi:hypothetical protein
MHILARGIVLSCLMALSAGFCQAAEPDDAPELPGPFFPYNVNGKKAGTYHCLVTQHHLDPAVLIFVRESAFEEGRKDGAVLADLLKKLDQRVDKNVAVRLAVFVVVVMDEKDKKTVVTDDDKRDQMDEEIKKWIGGQALTHIIFSLDSNSRLKAYALKDDSDLTIFLFRRYKVLARQELGTKGLTAEKVSEVLGDVKEKLGAVRE